MVVSLCTAQELEEILGAKYFYRQSIYRLAEDRLISSYEVNGVYYFSKEEVATQILQRLAKRLRNRLPRIITRHLRVKYDETLTKEIAIYGFSNGLTITANTELETEEDLLKKIENQREEVTKMSDIPVGPNDGRPDMPPPAPGPHHGPRPGPEEHHHDVMEALRRLEEGLRRIEEKLGR